MTELMIHPEALDLGILNPVGCLISGITPTSTASCLDDEIEQLMKTINDQCDTLLSRPEVLGFKDLFARMGYPNQVPAGQRLIESFQKHGFKRHNNIVDSYNVASALFGCGLGMHDASLLLGSRSDVHVYRAEGDEEITPLFKDKRVRITKNDLVYGITTCHMNILAWLGKRDVDSDIFKVEQNTSSILLMALGNAATSEEYNRGACAKTFELIHRSCPSAALEFLQVQKA